MSEFVNFETVQQQLIILLTTYGLRVVGAIIVLIIGWAVAGWASKKTAALKSRWLSLDPTLLSVLSSVVRAGILLLTLTMVLRQFGVETTSLVAMMGAAALAIGLALQGSLSNVASGVMLLVFRPFNVGEVVEIGGVTGTVEDIGIMLTRLNTPDNIYVVMPNNQVWSSQIRNFSHNSTRRLELVLGVGYGDDLEKAVELIERELAADVRVLSEPSSLVAVSELAESSVNILVRFWVKSSDFFPTKLDMIRRFKRVFDDAGISLPFPQRDIHLYQVETKSA